MAEDKHLQGSGSSKPKGTPPNRSDAESTNADDAAKQRKAPDAVERDKTAGEPPIDPADESMLSEVRKPRP